MRKLLIVVVDFIEEIVGLRPGGLRSGAGGKWNKVDEDPDCGLPTISLIGS